jgi:hypothetical protein
MSPELIFTITNNGVLPLWVLLAIAPRWKVTEWLAGSAVFSLVLAALYAVCLALGMGDGQADFFTLPGIQQLFVNPWAALAGWLHYLAFDLFIGCWEVRNARRVGIPHGLVIPCLFLTLMLGPVGLLAYFVLRWSRGQWLLPADGTAG